MRAKFARINNALEYNLLKRLLTAADDDTVSEVGDGIDGLDIGDLGVANRHATLLNGCKIGKNSIIGAGALVREGQIIPDNSLVVGCPAKILREVTPEQIADNTWNADHYIELAKKHKEL